MLLAFFLLLLLPFKGITQVENPAFDLLLQSLLSDETRQLNVAKADQLFEQDTSVVFVDCREADEYAVSHIPGARWVGYTEVDTDTLKKLPKDKTLILYCSIGYRSEMIYKQLMSLGYIDLYNLYGGIFEWTNKALPLNNEQGPTNKIHPYNSAWGIWLSGGDKSYN